MEFMELLKNRYSCKKYSNKPLEKEKLETILEAGRLAPTAKNMQEQHIYAAVSEDGLANVDKHTPCRYGAPVVLVVAYDKNNVYTYPDGQLTSGPEDVSIVATQMMLSAESIGVNSCWVNRFDPAGLAAELKLPENEQIVLLLDLGYAAEGGGPLPNHSLRKEISETVTYI